MNTLLWRCTKPTTVTHKTGYLRTAVTERVYRTSVWKALGSWLYKQFLEDLVIIDWVQQGHSHQIWGGQVRSVWHKHTTARGVGVVPRKILEFRGYEIASETIFGQVWCFSEARRQSFTWTNIYSFCSLHCTATFRLSDNSQSHTLRRWGLCNWSFALEEWKVVGRKTRKNSFALFAAISPVLTCHLCA